MHERLSRATRKTVLHVCDKQRLRPSASRKWDVLGLCYSHLQKPFFFLVSRLVNLESDHIFLPPNFIFF